MNNLINNKFFTIFFAPFLLGAITIFGFAPYNLTFVNFFTFSTLLFLISVIKKKTQSKYRKKRSNRYFFYLGCAFGFGFFLVGNYWISISLTHDEVFKFLIPFSIILIPFFLSLFFGLAILITGPFCEKNFYYVLFFALIFSIFEFLRGSLLTGFPWNLISYSLSWSIETIQILSFIGTYSLSLVSITFFCSPFFLLQKKPKKKNFIVLTILIIILVGNYVYGSNKIKKTIYNFDKNITVKVVSPNFSLEDYNSQSETNQLKRLIKISDPDKTRKTLFIWPEGIFYESYLQNIQIYKDLFFDNFSENHLIALGINNFINNKDLKDSKYYNSLVIVNHKLEIISVYNKINLVPFGEFLPFKSLLTRLGLKTVTQGYNSFSAGKKREIINLGDNFSNILILPLICYEIIYSGKVKTKNQHPDLVINISEDAWFGESVGPDQHYTKSLYRSVEEGVFIARSANKGISGFMDPNGRSLKILDRSESGNVELKFPNFFKKTFYSKYGNKIFILIIFLYMFLILILKKYKI